MSLELGLSMANANHWQDALVWSVVYPSHVQKVLSCSLYQRATEIGQVRAKGLCMTMLKETMEDLKPMNIHEYSWMQRMKGCGANVQQSYAPPCRVRSRLSHTLWQAQAVSKKTRPFHEGCSWCTDRGGLQLSLYPFLSKLVGPGRLRSCNSS